MSIPVQFIDKSKGEPSSWDWDFGDQSEHSNEKNPVHSYATPGDYDVTLISSNGGIRDVITTTITVYPPAPEALFDWSVDSTNHRAIHFNDLSVNYPTSWDWTFGDGYYSTLQNPTHIYPAYNATYPVTLNVRNLGGSSSYTLSAVTGASPGLNIDFGWQNYNNPGLNVDDNPYNKINLPLGLINRSTGSTSWEWDFGSIIQDIPYDVSSLIFATDGSTVAGAVTSGFWQCSVWSSVDGTSFSNNYTYTANPMILNDFVYINGLFIIIGSIYVGSYQSFLIYSSNLINWTTVTLPSIVGGITSIVYVNDHYVMCAGTGSVYAVYSSTLNDLSSWTSIATGFTTPVKAMLWDGVDIVAYYLGVDANVNKNIITSPTGVSWTTQNCPIRNVSRFLYVDGMYSTITSQYYQYTLYTSTNKVLWTPRNLPQPYSPTLNTYCTGGAYGNGKYVILTTTSYGSNYYDIFETTDFINWTSRSSNYPRNDTLSPSPGTEAAKTLIKGIVYNGKWVIATSFNSRGKYLYTPDMSTRFTYARTQSTPSYLENPQYDYNANGLLTFEDDQWGTYDVTLKINGGALTLTKTIEVAPISPPVADFVFTVNGRDATFFNTTQNYMTSWHWNFGDQDATSVVRNPVFSFLQYHSIYQVTLSVSSPYGDSTVYKTVNTGSVPDFPRVAPSYSGGMYSGMSGLITHNDKIYGNAWGYSLNGILEWDGSSAWNLVAPGFYYNQSDNGVGKGFVSFRHTASPVNEIYTVDPYGHLRKWDGVGAWVDSRTGLARVLNNVGAGRALSCTCVHNGKLFAGSEQQMGFGPWPTDNRSLYRYDNYQDGGLTSPLVLVAPTIAPLPGSNGDMEDIRGIVSYDGTLCAYTGNEYNNANGGRILKWNETNAWIDTGIKVYGNMQIGPFIYNNKFCFGFYNGPTGSHLCSWDGSSPTVVNETNTFPSFPHSVLVDPNGELFVASQSGIDHKTGNTFERIIATNIGGHDQYIYGNIYRNKIYYSSDVGELFLYEEPTPLVLALSYDSTRSLFCCNAITKETPNAWLWNFGDGTTSTLQNPIHTLLGTHTVRVDVWTSLGTHAFKSNIIAGLQPPVVDFNTSMSYRQVSVTNTTTGVVTDYLWNFGDGTTSSMQNPPPHIYANYETSYNITLTATNIAGSDTTTHLVTTLTPSVNFTYNIVSNVQVDFTNLTLGQNSSWLWNFGDGTTSLLQNPSHTYDTSGIYTVNLTVTGGYSHQAPVNTLLPPVSFTKPNYSTATVDVFDAFLHMARGNSQGIYNAVTESSYASSSPFDTEWSQVYSSAQTGIASLGYTYWSSAVGAYPLTMLGKVIYMHHISADRYFEMHFNQWTSGGNGGGFSYLRYEMIVAKFDYTWISSTHISFNDLSSTLNTSWDWNFGDGSPHGTTQNPSHIYATPGSYTVTLIVAGGDSYSRVIHTTYPPVSFTKPNYSTATVDVISSSLHMARGNSQGIYNAVTESSYSDYISPSDTEWSSILNIPITNPGTLTYTNWKSAVGGDPLTMLGKVIYMHLISENRYFEMHFTQWTSSNAGGGFAYTRYEV